jgi:hypothetical protein
MIIYLKQNTSIKIWIMLEVSFLIHENINEYIRDYDLYFLKYKKCVIISSSKWL